MFGYTDQDVIYMKMPYFMLCKKPESFQKVEYINRNFDSCVIKEKFDFLPSWQFSHFIGIFLS